MSIEKFIPLYTANKSLSSKLLWNKSRLRLRFEGSCLKQGNTTSFDPNNVVNLFIIYELDIWSRDLNAKFTLKDCLFGNVKITKNADPDKYSYSGYGNGFDSCSHFSIPNFDWDKNAASFGVDISSSVHIDNNNRDILILGKGPTQGLDDTRLAAEAEYSINFSRSQRKFCLSIQYNGSNCFLSVNATKIYHFKAEDSEIKKYPLCLGNISKDSQLIT